MSLKKEELINERVIGIDIGILNVRLVELTCKKNSYFLDSISSEPLKNFIMSDDGNIIKFDELLVSVRRLIQKSKIKSKKIVFGLPYSAIVSKKVLLPNGLQGKEFKAYLESEVARYIPFAIEDVSLDWQIDNSNNSEEDKIGVIFACTRKEKVQQMQDLADELKLELVSLYTENYAKPLAISRVNNFPDIFAICEVKDKQTYLQVMNNNEILYEGVQETGIYHLYQLISRQYNLDIDTIEDKIKTNTLPINYGSEVLDNFIDNLADDIEQLVNLFYISDNLKKINHIVYIGEDFLIKKIITSVKDRLNISGKTVDPFAGMNLSNLATSKEYLKDSLLFTNACGLAIRGLYR